MGIRIATLTLLLALGLGAPTAAFASLADEQFQGRQLAAQLKSGRVSCKGLSAADLDHIGEYVMGRAVGSTSVHQAMNDRMTQMMGGQTESRMHQILGARYVGCPDTAARKSGSTYGNMMGGYFGNSGWGTMMGSNDYRWMTGSTWNHMSRQDWQRLQRQWLGIAPQRHHMNGMAIIAISLAVALLIAALALLGFRRRTTTISADARGRRRVLSPR